MKADRKKVEVAMARACMNPGDIVKATQMRPGTVRKVLKGESVRPSTLGRVAKSLGVDPFVMLAEEDWNK